MSSRWQWQERWCHKWHDNVLNGAQDVPSSFQQQQVNFARFARWGTKAPLSPARLTSHHRPGTYILSRAKDLLSTESCQHEGPSSLAVHPAPVSSFAENPTFLSACRLYPASLSCCRQYPAVLSCFASHPASLALLGTESCILKFHPTPTDLQCEVVVPCLRRRTRSIEPVLAHVQQFKVVRVRKLGGPRGHIPLTFANNGSTPITRARKRFMMLNPVHESHHGEGFFGHVEETARFEERQGARRHCVLRMACKADARSRTSWSVPRAKLTCWSTASSRYSHPCARWLKIRLKSCALKVSGDTSGSRETLQLSRRAPCVFSSPPLTRTG